MSQTSDPHEPVVFVIIAVLGVMVIIALHLAVSERTESTGIPESVEF